MRQPHISSKQIERLGWERMTPASWGKCAQRWEHTSGWTLEHCGHPTAHWPWLLYDPNGNRVLTGIIGPYQRADFGTAWPNLLEPMQYVFQLTQERTHTP